MIAQTIQLALAPVFLLVAMGNLLNILSVRLSRVVDRSRALSERHAATEGLEHDDIVREFRGVDKRIDLITKAILLLVVSGLIVGLTVAVLFVEELAGVDLRGVAAATFLSAIALLMAALLLLVREIQLAAALLRIPREYLELDRRL